MSRGPNCVKYPNRRSDTKIPKSQAELIQSFWDIANLLLSPSMSGFLNRFSGSLVLSSDRRSWKRGKEHLLSWQGEPSSQACDQGQQWSWSRVRGLLELLCRKQFVSSGEVTGCWQGAGSPLPLSSRCDPGPPISANTDSWPPVCVSSLNPSLKAQTLKIIGISFKLGNNFPTRPPPPHVNLLSKLSLVAQWLHGRLLARCYWRSVVVKNTAGPVRPGTEAHEKWLDMEGDS